jgi:hypothetical protein
MLNKLIHILSTKQKQYNSASLIGDNLKEQKQYNSASLIGDNQKKL